MKIINILVIFLSLNIYAGGNGGGGGGGGVGPDQIQSLLMMPSFLDDSPTDWEVPSDWKTPKFDNALPVIQDVPKLKLTPAEELDAAAKLLNWNVVTVSNEKPAIRKFDVLGKAQLELNKNRVFDILTKDQNIYTVDEFSDRFEKIVEQRAQDTVIINALEAKKHIQSFSTDNGLIQLK